MAEIRWSKEAADCLEQIYAYITRDNPTAAHKVVAGIYEKIQMLSRQPRIGHRSPTGRSARFSMATTGSLTLSSATVRSRFSVSFTALWTLSVI